MKDTQINVYEIITLSVIAAFSIIFISSRVHAQTIKADHTMTNVDSVSQAALDKARALRMSLDHASVGQNIKDGMNQLSSQDEKRYSYKNWYWRKRGNPGWKAKVDQFVKWVDGNSESYDVFMMKFCYIDEDADFSYYRDEMLSLEGRHPSKKIVWWTMPIMTDVDKKRDAFNSAVRTYCSENGKPLFDIADIQSHDSSGSAVRSDGEALVEAYSSDGGHLNEKGALRVAKGLWSLMILLSGETLPEEISKETSERSLAEPGEVSDQDTNSKRESSGMCSVSTAQNHGVVVFLVATAGLFLFYRIGKRRSKR